MKYRFRKTGEIVDVILISNMAYGGRERSSLDYVSIVRA